MPGWTHFLVVILYIYIFITILYLLLDNRETATTLSWLLVFLLFPFVGIFFYFLFGRGMRKKVLKTLVRQNLENRLKSMGPELVAKQKQEMQILLEQYASPANRKLIRLLYRNSDSILTRDNNVRLFFNGHEKFDVLLKDMDEASQYIHMEYFIWEEDALSERVVEVLRKKIRQGIEVRILYDVVGNYLSKRYLKRLRSMGIRIYPYYNFLSPLKIHTLNYRNHRKIVVIDGITGYIGGMNMGQEYVDGGSRFPGWRDTHIRIQGASVFVLQEIFRVSWYNTTLEQIAIKPYLLPVGFTTGATPTQITTSGPDSEWESIKQVYFLLISSAEKTIYINSPYFIPDTSIVMALKTAALSGVDVRIILTGLLDKRLPYWVALTYLKDLLKAGVRFYYYTAGFMHSKTIVVDSNTCSVGTANMDIRSFQLNYEISALIYDKAVAGELESQFFKDISVSREFTLKDYDGILRIQQLRNSLARLFAPLL